MARGHSPIALENAQQEKANRPAPEHVTNEFVANASKERGEKRGSDLRQHATNLLNQGELAGGALEVWCGSPVRRLILADLTRSAGTANQSAVVGRGRETWIARVSNARLSSVARRCVGRERACGLPHVGAPQISRKRGVLTIRAMNSMGMLRDRSIRNKRINASQSRTSTARHTPETVDSGSKECEEQSRQGC
jgi:hypothetical protein